MRWPKPLQGRWVRRVIGLAAVGVSAGLLMIAARDHPAYQAVFSKELPVSAKNFFSNVAPEQREMPHEVDRLELTYWHNYDRLAGIVPGHFETSPFTCPGAELFVPVRGATNSPQAGIYLERLKDGQRFWINWGAAHEQWQPA